MVVCAALGRQIEDLCIELILDLLKCAELVTVAQKDDNQSRHLSLRTQALSTEFGVENGLLFPALRGDERRTLLSS